jgi:membrane-associated protease RseP (regulator of RpoE activity)
MEHRVRPWVHILLFLITIATTTLAGAAQQGVDLLREPGRFTAGLPFSLSLLAILGCHEMGHYFAARRHGVNVTPPYFIPVPFALGTFVAFIKMRSPTENRRQLFDIAIAGPLAGLVVALPVLYFGFQSSQIFSGASQMPDGATSLHPSLLFVLIGKLALGQQLFSGAVVHLSPLAFAGWLGLFVTALNLLPIGQLDGGHITRAMFGTRTGQIISTVAMWGLLGAALFLWPGLMLFALFVFFMAGRPAPPLNDLSPVSPARRALGYATFVILAAIIVPGM